VRARLAKNGSIKFSEQGIHSGKVNCVICAKLGDFPCLKGGPLTTRAHSGYSNRLMDLQLWQRVSPQQEKPMNRLIVSKFGERAYKKFACSRHFPKKGSRL